MIGDTSAMRYDCRWDAENRLVYIGPDPLAPADWDLKDEFAYDYLGRRIEKIVSEYRTTPTADWYETGHRAFIWAGWLMLMELQDYGTPSEPNFQPVRKYTWGLDLAAQNGQVNSLEGAGGIGGLLAVYDLHDTPATPGDDYKYVYAYDGNGNVVQVLDWGATSATAAMKARYQWDPYGNSAGQMGTYAARNPFRFSTKYWDDNFGLGYWGYRWYSPVLGRWISRDPIGEEGGMAMYAYSGNCPAVYWDPTGLCQARTSIAVTEAQARGHIDTTIDVYVTGERCCDCCDHVRFVQIVDEHTKLLFGRPDLVPRVTYGPWENDPGAAGWYLYVENKGPIYRDGAERGRLWQFRDEPGVNNYWLYSYLRQEFQTCAVCEKSGAHDTAAFCVIACWQWGHEWARGTPDTHTWHGGPGPLTPEMERAIGFKVDQDHRSPLSETYSSSCGW